MNDGLKDKYRQAIIEILSANPRVERAVLFGSRAMETFTTTSDVDIALYGDELTLTDQARLIEAIDELPIPQRVDLLLHKTIKNKNLLKHINKHGMEWYRRSGTMPSDWQILTLAKAGVELIDCIHKTPKDAGIGYPYIGIPQMKNGHIDFSANPRHITHDDFLEWSKKARPKRGDVVLSRRFNPGETAYVPPNVNFAIGQNLVLLRANSSSVHPAFLRWLVKGPEWWEQVAKFINVGAVFNSLRCADVPKFKLIVPPLYEQRAIAHILGSLDDKIELNRRMNQTLEAMARAIFKSWFVDFDPVRAKAEGRDPGLPDDIAALFPDSFEDSEHGEIPEGWNSRSLYDSAKYINGAAYRNFHFTDEEGALPVVKIAELKNGVTGQTKFTKTALDDKYRIGDGEILLSWSGNPDTSIGTFVWCGGAAWLNQHIFRVLPHKDIEMYFVFYLLKYLRPVFAEIARDKQTTGLGHFTARDMKRLMVVHPPENILTIFNNSVGPMFDRWYANLFETNTLASLRDTLLPKLISGELRVPDAEKFVEEAGL
jgi:type I restriction enzyme S subunit